MFSEYGNDNLTEGNAKYLTREQKRKIDAVLENDIGRADKPNICLGKLHFYLVV